MFVEGPPDWSFDLEDSADCELCGASGAAVLHLLRVVDGAITHTHLCPECAETMAEQTEGIALVLALPSLFKRLAKGERGDDSLTSTPHCADDLFCGVCGTTLTDFNESGTVGCANCYVVFDEALKQALEGEAAPVEHAGKIPTRGGGSDTARHEVMRLERMLRELVECERFEEAAGVRDRLAELGQESQGGAS